MKTLSFILLFLLLSFIRVHAEECACEPESMEDRVKKSQYVFLGYVDDVQEGKYSVTVHDICKGDLTEQQNIIVESDNSCVVNLQPCTWHSFIADKDGNGNFIINSCKMANDAWDDLKAVCEASLEPVPDLGKLRITIPISISITMEQNFEGENKSEIGGPTMVQVSHDRKQKAVGKEKHEGSGLKKRKKLSSKGPMRKKLGGWR